MFCPKCGEENPDNTQFCRECGEQLPDAVAVYGEVPADLPEGPPSSALAITALVLACVGLVTCGLTAIPGLILGIVALVAAKRNPLKIAGQGMAIAAIAVSAVLLVFATASVLVFAVGMGGALEQAHGEARKTRDRVNLHNISIGIMLYVADEGGAYPDSLADLLDGGAYLDDPSVLLCPGDLTPGRLADGAPCSYEYIGALPAMPPAQVIVAYTREGIFPDGRNVLRADATIRWYGEQELSGPAGLLADSYARVVTWLGDDLTEERDAELRSFYGIAAVQEE